MESAVDLLPAPPPVKMLPRMPEFEPGSTGIIGVLGLDKSAAAEYLRVFKEALGIVPGWRVDYKDIAVRARVVGDDFNDPELVGADAAFAINEYVTSLRADESLREKLLKGELPIWITLACNTVGVPDYQIVIERILQEKYGLIHGVDYSLWTPLRAVFEDAANRKDSPLLGGTVPTSKAVARAYVEERGMFQVKVQTLYSEDLVDGWGRPVSEVQKTTAAATLNRIIQLDKLVNGSDVSGAPEWVRFIDVSTEQGRNDAVVMLREYVGNFFRMMRRLGIKKMYIACTELPDAFWKYCPEEWQEFRDSMELIDPAQLAGDQMKKALGQDILATSNIAFTFQTPVDERYRNPERTDEYDVGLVPAMQIRFLTQNLGIEAVRELVNLRNKLVSKRLSYLEINQHGKFITLEGILLNPEAVTFLREEFSQLQHLKAPTVSFGRTDRGDSQRLYLHQEKDFTEGGFIGKGIIAISRADERDVVVDKDGIGRHVFQILTEAEAQELHLKKVRAGHKNSFIRRIPREASFADCRWPSTEKLAGLPEKLFEEIDVDKVASVPLPAGGYWVTKYDVRSVTASILGKVGMARRDFSRKVFDFVNVVAKYIYDDDPEAYTVSVAGDSFMAIEKARFGVQVSERGSLLDAAVRAFSNLMALSHVSMQLDQETELFVWGKRVLASNPPIDEGRLAELEQQHKIKFPHGGGAEVERLVS